MRNKLISSLAGAAFSFAASGLAFAADMGAPPPAPVYNWTGWYAGVNLGASMGSVKTDFNAAPIFANGIPNQITSGFGFSNREYPDGFIGGGQIGYNWQYSPLIVVGFEADFQGALEKVTNNFGPRVVDFVNDSISGCGPPAEEATSCTATGRYATQIDWFGTVRARIGYVWGNGEVMSYLTGGLAYGEVKINGTNTVSGPAICEPCNAEFVFSQTQTFGHSQINTGWVVGYGTEGHLPLMPGNWTWKIEGLWMDLGTLDTTSVTTGVSVNRNVTLTGGQVTTHSHFTDGILRAGLNYQFH